MNQDQRIIYINDDGTISIIIPSPQFIDEKIAQGMNADQITALLSMPIPQDKRASSFIINKNELPSSRTFRSAWKNNGNSVQVHMPTASQIKMAIIRAERNKRLNDSDIDLLKLDEIGSMQDKQNIRQKRQSLRDLPVSAQIAVDNFNTPEELEAYEPNWPV